MDCRAFRKRHLAFVDDTLPGVELTEMRGHLEICKNCSAWDHRIRRSLMVVRSHLGGIEPSAGFRDRLSARLDAERELRKRSSAFGAPFRWTSVATVGLVMSILVVSAALSVAGADSAAGITRLPPVVSTPDADVQRAGESLPNATPAFVATMSTGMAILPALMLAEEVPIRRLSGDASGTLLRTAGLTIPNPAQR